jgi:hypothetical protein
VSAPYDSDQWEYHLGYITTETRLEQAFLQENFPGKRLPRYAVQAALPELNALGEQGWELVQMQPVSLGENGDVLVAGGDMRKWTNTYFCVFKRRKT